MGCCMRREMVMRRAHVEESWSTVFLFGFRLHEDLNNARSGSWTSVASPSERHGHVNHSIKILTLRNLHHLDARCLVLYHNSDIDDLLSVLDVCGTSTVCCTSESQVAGTGCRTLRLARITCQTHARWCLRIARQSTM